MPDKRRTTPPQDVKLPAGHLDAMNHVAAIASGDINKLSREMEVLTFKQRKYVLAKVEFPNASQATCAKLAGYECANEESFRGTAYATERDKKVQAAIIAEASARLTGADILAAHRVAALLNHADPRIVLRAAEAIWDRTGMGKVSEQNINVNHDVKPESSMARIAQMCAQLGMDPQLFLGRAAQAAITHAAEAITVKDAEYVEVSPVLEPIREPEINGSEGLEDIL